MRERFHHFLENLRKQPVIWLISLLAGGCLALLVYAWHWQLPLFSRSRMLVAALLALGSAAAIVCFLQAVTLPLFDARPQSRRWILLALAAAAGLLLALGLDFSIPHLYPLYPAHALSITLDLRDLPAGSEGISFSHLDLAFRSVSYSEMDISGEFEMHADAIHFPSGQLAAITWRGITGEQAQVYFLPASQPVKAQIAWDDQIRELDLRGSAGSLPSAAFAFPAPVDESALIRAAVFPLLALGFFILFTGLASPHPYAYILLAVWLFIYLLYYPGIIGSVNILAVDDLLQGHPSDWHPLSYTLLTAFSIMYLASASSLLLLQIFSLALVFGGVFTFFEQRGIARSRLIGLSLLIALLPSNFLSVITLTNDIPFSIALLALTYLAVRIVLSSGEWLRGNRNVLLLAAAATLTILFRYNGLPAVALFFICLLLIFPRFWRRSAMALLLTAAAWLLVSGPLSSALNVSAESEGHLDNILLHHISAHVSEGTPLTEEESAYLNSLLPLENWQYSCCSNTAMWQNDNFDREAFHTSSAYNRQLALSLFARNPALEVKHMLCAGSLVWDPAGTCEVQHPEIEFLRGDFFWTGSYFPQYQEKSFLPALVAPLSTFLLKLEASPLISSLLWRPAWYLYLAILSIITLCVRFKDASWLLGLAPLLGNSAFLLLFNRVQNFRYQYCAVLIGMMLLALVFYHPEKKE